MSRYTKSKSTRRTAMMRRAGAAVAATLIGAATALSLGAGSTTTHAFGDSSWGWSLPKDSLDTPDL